MIYWAAMVFMVLDIVTGLMDAVKDKRLNSTVFRNGLYKKVGSGFFIAFGVAVDYFQGTVNLGFSMPVGATICAAVIVMESVSILENVGELNPDLVKTISPFLEKLNGGNNGNSK